MHEYVNEFHNDESPVIGYELESVATRQSGTMQNGCKVDGTVECARDKNLTSA